MKHNDRPDYGPNAYWRCPTCQMAADDTSCTDRLDPHTIEDEWSGVIGLAWTEVHCCPNCGTVWKFYNSDL